MPHFEQRWIPPGYHPVTRSVKNGVASHSQGSRILNQRAAISRERLLVCQGCEETLADGAGCRRHKACCFGAWRAVETNRCPIGKW